MAGVSREDTKRMDDIWQEGQRDMAAHYTPSLAVQVPFFEARRGATFNPFIDRFQMASTA